MKNIMIIMKINGMKTSLIEGQPTLSLFLLIFKGGINMPCRRKLKSERELVADVNKAIRTYCQHHDCDSCQFYHKQDCRFEYLKYLFDLCHFEEEEDYLEYYNEHIQKAKDENRE